MWNADERDNADRNSMAAPRSWSTADRVLAHLVMLGWHGLVITAYFVLLDRQSHVRVNYGNSPWEDMWIFGVTLGAPVLLGTLLVGLILLRKLLMRGRTNSAVVLGTAAASPTLLFVAVAAGPVLR